MDNKLLIWLSRLKKLKLIQKKLILEKIDSVDKIWSLNKTELINLIGKDCIAIDEILNKKYRENLDIYENYIIKNNIKIISIFSNEYPKKLKNIYDPPVILFAKGNISLLNKDSIAIVGARECSDYGKTISKEIAYNLAKKDKCVVSGLARGIDKYAHIGALQAEGSTIAVIGNGLDIIYPYENKKIFERILENNGLIITEYIIGTKPEKINFPQRNRIISGISDGIVVVEAKEKSGSLITADFALEQGKEIFAVPGNINNENSIGTNDLIKEGAHILTNYTDILEICYKYA